MKKFKSHSIRRRTHRFEAYGTKNIDHMAYSRKLGSIFEAKVGEGNLLVCTMDILNQMEKYPEVRQNV